MLFRSTYARLVAVRDRIDAQELPWSELAQFFTEDAVFIDPGWGRIEGRENIAEFFVKSMVGLTENGWVTPERFVVAEGHRLVAHWDQVLGLKDDGSAWSVPGISILYYAGDGLFCYEQDLINMKHLGEVLRAMQWSWPPEMNQPPQPVNRDTSMPERWAHLAR